ncbi:hypothetical protein ACWC10_17075 [Streptomyces sp. NPDC001595]|uniref:hypothetical protein n=1 Tax=Streptomyces sp. NPDC001532 TaxID=3154520 RepID=UPI0033343D62
MVHGDISGNNLLVDGGTLSAVVDGWALWKSAVTVTEGSDPRDERVATHLRVIDSVLADHVRFARPGGTGPSVTRRR